MDLHVEIHQSVNEDQGASWKPQWCLCVCMNMVSMFFVTQFFPMGLCEMRFGMHLVISSSVLLMTIFVYVLLPETQGVEVDDASEIWKTHLEEIHGRR